MKLPITERFISINGEGKKAGELSYFVRFAGCNLKCSYCDTPWSQCPESHTELLPVSQITEILASSGISNVTLTGGEPLLQPLLPSLVSSLIANGHDVEIETNGSVAIEPLAALRKPGTDRLSITMDYKLPDSNMEGLMHLENLNVLDKYDSVKFVASSPADLAKALEIIEHHDLTNRTTVYFSPVAGRIEAAEVVAFLKEKQLNRVKLQLQLHKFIWNPNERGV